jgi:phage baseplate assembly protein W
VAIKLPNLEQIAQQYNSNSPFVYQDLHLDFARATTYNNTLGIRLQKNDIQTDYDEDAIRNSLRNLFNTRPGQRFLFPLYGLDMNQFLFENITPSNARLIGEKIVSSINNYEPRVTVLNVDVQSDPDNNQYNITIIVQIPIFNSVTTLNTRLNAKTQSFVFIQTPRNQ